MVKKKYVLIVVCLLAILGFSPSAYIVSAADAADSIVLKVAVDTVEEHPKGSALRDMEKYILEKTNGALTLEFYWNNTLGNAAAYGDLMINGSIEMGIVGSEYGERIPKTFICDMPFMFANWDEVKKFCDSDYGKNFFKELPETVGIRQLAFNPQGFREIISNKAVRSMADFKGLRLRVPQINTYTALAEDLGASPTALSLTEVYTAIEQHAVDALENTWSYLNSAKYYEVTQYLIETNHTFTMHNLFINEAKFQSLSPEHQAIIQEAADLFELKCYDYYKEYETIARQNIEANGVEIITPDETFRKQIVESQGTAFEILYQQFPETEQIVSEVKAIIAQ